MFFSTLYTTLPHTLIKDKLSEPEFYGDLVNKLKKIVGSNIFSVKFIKIISHYKKIGHNINVLQQTVCLVVNPITVHNFAFLFNCKPAGRTSDSMTVSTESKMECKDQELIESRTTPDSGYKWERDKLTVIHHKREPRVQPFPSR